MAYVVEYHNLGNALAKLLEDGQFGHLQWYVGVEQSVWVAGLCADGVPSERKVLFASAKAGLIAVSRLLDDGEEIPCKLVKETFHSVGTQ